MRVLVVDRDGTNGLTHAVQLSGYGLVVETVRDVDEAAHRMATMAFDVVLFSLDVDDDVQKETLLRLQKSYPSTEFFTKDRIEEFLGRFRIGQCF